MSVTKPRLSQGAAVDISTGATSYDISTTIPTWAKKITIPFETMDAAGAGSMHIFQIGDATGGWKTSGYVGSCNVGGSTTAITAGFGVYHNAPGMTMSGNMIITLVDPTAYIWTASASYGRTDAASSGMSGGSVTLSGPLDRLRLTTVNGTDTFNDGTVGIIWE